MGLSWLDDISFSDNDGDVAQLGTRIAGRLLAHRLVWARATCDPFILRVLDQAQNYPSVAVFGRISTSVPPIASLRRTSPALALFAN